jgi:hypothetical protein
LSFPDLFLFTQGLQTRGGVFLLTFGSVYAEVHRLYGKSKQLSGSQVGQVVMFVSEFWGGTYRKDAIWEWIVGDFCPFIRVKSVMWGKNS